KKKGKAAVDADSDSDASDEGTDDDILSAQRLIDAARRRDVGAVRTLLSGSAGSVAGYINWKGEGGLTALHGVSVQGNLEMVRLLLEKGAAIEAKTEGRLEVVQLLVEKRADTQAKNKNGETPLDVAKDDATREVLVQFIARVAKRKKNNQRKRKKKGKAAVDADSDSDASDEGTDDVKEPGRSSAPLPAPRSALPLPPTAVSSSFATAAATIAPAPAPAPAPAYTSATAAASTVHAPAPGAELAQRLQWVFRGRRVRRGLDLGALRRTRDERQGRRTFDSRWGGVVEGVGAARGGRGGSGSRGAELGEFMWEVEKAKYDMVLDRGSIEGESEGEGGGWDCKALQQILEDVAFTPAPPSSSFSSSSAWEALPLPTGAAGSRAGPKEGGGGEEQWQEQEEGQVLGPIIHEIELAHSVVRWLEGADAVHRDMFYSRMRMLASDHRSYAYSKRLVGSRVPLLETKLDRGVRILWSQLRRGREKPAIIIWFVAKHDRVPRLMELVSRCFRYRDWGQEQTQIQTKGQGQGHGQGQGVEEGGEESEGGSVELGEDESLLDPVGNAPLKTYTLDLQAQAQAHSSSVGGSGSSSGKKLPLRLSRREREVNLAVGTVLLLGRSGTGKTVCLCNRMASDRQANPVSSQLFVCRSRRLRDSVQRYQWDYGNLDRDSSGGSSGDSGGNGGGSGGVQSHSLESAFLTLDAFLDAMESRVLGAAHTSADTDAGAGAGTATGAVDSGCGSGSGSSRTYLPSKRVDFKRFKEQIFPSFGKPKLDPLVAWTQIRSFIKGSVEALLGEGAAGGSTSSSGSSSSGASSSGGSRALSLPAYLALAKGRCRLQPPERAEAYAVYAKYKALLVRAGLWDDCDRVMRILLAAGLHLPLGKSGGDGGGSGFGQVFDKVYVDE
ncbi:hypothetical protein B484DRAFT_392733, partial [Ochromonadaceae sp. CCMP2298]